MSLSARSTSSGTAVSSRPNTRRYLVLNSAQLKKVAVVGGVGIAGLGTLKGKLKLVNGKKYLVTVGEGTRSEVRFAIGKGVKVTHTGGKDVVYGVIGKQTPYGGTITKPKPFA